MDQPLDRLRRLSLNLKQQLEQAEARIADANEIVRQFTAEKLVPELVLEGKNSTQLYGVFGEDDSALVVVPLLRIPGGFGAAYYDMNDFWAWQQNAYPGDFIRDAYQKFVPFDALSGDEKLLVASQVSSLLQQFELIVKDQVRLH